MEALLGFKLDLWDYVTFLTLFLFVAAGLAMAVFLLGLPGRIAIARLNPDARAVKLMGYLSFLAVVPWIQAFMWAFKPTNIADARCGTTEWRPRFGDYLYLGFTNMIAFSPTDVLPLAPWAKLLMAVQAMESLVILVLVVGRAVNVLI